MNVAVVYVYPMVNVRTYFPLARRFAETYLQFAAGEPHALHLIANGASPTKFDRAALDGVAGEWHTHSNIGWDIGAFQWAAENIPGDLLVCLGAHCHFHRDGWLARMVEAYLENGPAFYGTRGYFYVGHHHIRTTCFWLPPELLVSYPELVGGGRGSRYKFEHGSGNMTEWTEKNGLPALVVTWDGVYAVDEWQDGFGPDGDYSALVFDQWTNRGGNKLDRK